MLAQQKKPAEGLRNFQPRAVRPEWRASSFAVDGHLLFDVGVVEVFERDYAGDLDGVELAGVDVAFDLAEGGDDGGVARGPADAPAGHVEGFGEGVEFNGDVHGRRGFRGWSAGASSK